MSEKTGKKDQIFELPIEGVLEPIKLKTVPVEAVPQSVNERLVEDFRPYHVKWSETWLVPKFADFGMSGKVYILAFMQSTVTDATQELIKTVFAVDVSNDGEVMGSGNSAIYLNEDRSVKEGPEVRYTDTEPEFRQRGLALRRLIVLHQANRFYFKLRLESGSFSGGDPYAERAWERLKEAGLVSQDDLGGYRFIY